jgi:hypothetical protein
VSDLRHEAMSAPAAGWYPDPSDPGSSRWWSGEAWTDHKQPAAVAAVPALAPVAEPAPVPVMVPAMASASPFPAVATTPDGLPAVIAPAPGPTAPARSNLDAQGVPFALFADSVFSPDVLIPPAKPTTQSDWHSGTSGRGAVPKRQSGGSVSLSTSLPNAASRKHDPYRQRNWIAGLAIVLAVLSIPALGARVLVDLPPVTQSIFGGAPIAISLLALVVSIRRGSGLVLSIVAILISGAVLAAGLLLDQGTLKSIVEQVLALLP